jgi:PAS domain S-box-containing protein
MEPGGRRSGWIRGRLAPTLGVCLALLVLEAGLLPEPQALWASNLLQLSLAAAAAFACFRAAARERGLGRWFFALLGLGMALWAAAQTVLTLTISTSPARPLVALQDLVFVSSTAPLVAACALRPHRPRPGALGLAADVGLLCLLTMFLHAYFAFAEQALGGPDVSPQNPVFFNPQRLMVLAGLLWLLRGSASAWRRLYDEIALAMVVFLGVGVLPNLALFAGTYRPGLQDVAWTLPFLWVALAAGEWQPQQDPAATELEHEAGWQAPVWKETRHGNAIALAAVALVPAVHQLATLVGSPSPEVAALRARIALVGTLLVGGLYLARQLHILRRAEGMQQAREERFRALVEHSADATGVLDRAGRFCYLSASTERVTGYRPDQLLGTSPLDLVHPDEQDALRRTLGELASRPRASAQGFVRYRHRDDAIRHGGLRAVNQLDVPAVGGIVLHLHDVTEQRRAEEQRERSLSLLEATLESTADGILVTSRAGRIVRFNQKFASMWRIPQELLATGDAERAVAFVLDQFQQPRAFLDRLDRLYAQPEAESFDTLRLRDGRVFERYSQPQRLLGEVVGRVYSFRDVSERAHAEAAMARLGAVIEATPDFVATCDGSLRTLYVNRAGRGLLGLTPDEPLAERHIAEFHPARAAARLLEEAVPQALREGVWSGENLLRRNDGREIPVLQVVLAHRSQGGEVDFLSTIARDISQRIAAEQELRRSHTMAALGSLVAGVAHEVRNPLFGISSTLDAFEARFGSHQDHRQYVHVLREQLERLTSLMNDLLEYAKPTRLQLTQGRLQDIVAQAIAACAALGERARVTIEARVPRELPALRVDERRLGQVFRNLLENALQHTPGGGHISLETRLVHDRAAAWVECSIEDDGPGFQPDDLPHIFEPFFTRRHAGTGLGLSIVHRIVTDHGGTIAAGNRPQGGARVTVTLPATPQPPGGGP